MAVLITGCTHESIGPIASGSIKLVYHPELLAGGNADNAVMDDAAWLRSSYPYGKFQITEDRYGISSTWDGPMEFDVVLPPDARLAFEWGFNTQSRYANPNFKLSISLSKDGKTDIVREVSKPDRLKEYKVGWQPESVDISMHGAGPAKLIFIVEGAQSPEAKKDFHLANPRIFSAASKKHRRVVVIGVDTLRADHLSSYGYSRLTSPTIDGLASDGVRYSRCISTSPWTFPSFSSIQTGRYPSVCGATTNITFLPEDETTLAEVLSKEGFSTLMAVNHVFAGPPVNHRQGFDTAIRFPLEKAEVTFKTAEGWLTEHSREDTFIFMQFMDTHVPYSSPAPFDTMFDPGYTGPYEKEFTDFEEVRSGEKVLDTKEVEHIKALYDGGIAYFDSQLGEFIGYLDENNFLDETLIVLVSDHGEEFFDHGKYEHGHCLYDELLHVPLIMSGPGIERGKVDGSLVSTMDLFPTILDYLKIDIPRNLNGVSLLAGPPDENRLLIAEQLRYGEELKGVTSKQYRYIYHTVTGTEELYDFTKDPAMLSNVAQDRKATARSFRAFVESYTLSTGSPWHVNFQRAGPITEKVIYSGTITCDGGFSNVKGLLLDDKDLFDIEGGLIRFRVTLTQGTQKEITFTTNDETSPVNFNLEKDDHPVGSDVVFIGPALDPMPETKFSLGLFDDRFGLGQPVLRTEVDDGIFIWANPSRERGQLTPDLTPEMVEQLKSVGYLN